MPVAVERAALGALPGPRRRAVGGATETACAPSPCRVAVEQVLLEVGDLLLTDGPEADFLVPFEMDAVLAAEATAAVLAAAYGFATTAPQE